MNIRTYGTDERLGFCREYLYKSGVEREYEIILLPIPSSRGGKLVLDDDKIEEELCACSEASCDGVAHVKSGELVVVGYGIPRGLKDRLSDIGALALDVSLDEEFVSENARLTAIGTVGKILSSEIAAPSELSIGIIGYGRIGKRLLNILSLLGASPTVFTANEQARLEFGIMGVKSAPYSALESAEALGRVGKFDIIINTAPVLIIKDEAVEALLETKIIELASGNNFPVGIDALRLPSLPAKMYPKSAGKALRDSILRMLGEDTLK